MVYRKLDLRIYPSILFVLKSALSKGARCLLFEELELFASTPDKSLYRSECVDGEFVYEIGVGGVLRAFVIIDDEEGALYLINVELF